MIRRSGKPVQRLNLTVVNVGEKKHQRAGAKMHR
jgi:hypothetical protein